VRAIRPGVIVALSERCQGLLSKGAARSCAGNANVLRGGGKRLSVRAVKAAGLAFIGAHEQP
jgi:hypothetical protein